jgi:hypothetical protein
MSRSTWNLLLQGFVLTMLVAVIDGNLALHHFDQAISMAVWAVLMFNMGRVATKVRARREVPVRARGRSIS